MRLSGRKASSYAPSWKSRQRVVLLSLIGVNFAIFVVQLVLQAYRPTLIPQYLGLSYRGIDDAYAWQFLTAMFLHAGVFQFAGNMIVLYFIGRDIDAILGARHFLYLYVCGAFGGELGHLFSMPATTVLAGGSGGVAAMIVIPAIDLLGGKVVRLVEGKRERATVFSDRPGDVADRGCVRFAHAIELERGPPDGHRSATITKL